MAQEATSAESLLAHPRQAPAGAGERPAVSVVPDDLHALRAVEGTAAGTGQEFFRSLVCHLAEAIDVPYATVCEFRDPPRGLALAVWERDRVSEYLDFDFTVTVQKAYQQFLHRAADPAGLTFWTGFLQQGHTVEQMDAGIVGSAEYFQTRGGGTTNGFLTALYQDALGRAVDPAGQNFFTQQLAGGVTTAVATAGGVPAGGMTTAQVAGEIFASAEFQQGLVKSDYALLLNRAADNAGVAFFTNAFQQGLTDQQIAAAIAGSDEFFARA